MNKLSLLLLIAVFALLTACSRSAEPDAGSLATSTPEPTPTAPTPLDLAALQKQVWVLLQLGDPANPTPALPNGPTLELGDGQLSGSAACNRYFGSYALVDGRLQITGPLGSTMMACEDARMAQEAAFLQALQALTNVALVDGKLVIDYPGGQLVFAPQQPLPLQGTLWQLLSFSLPTGITSTLLDTTITAEFGDVTVVGSSGCNNYFADFEALDDVVTIGPLGMTKMACAEEINQQEMLFAELLQAAVKLTIAGDTLTLTTADGRALTFKGEAKVEPPLAGPTWKLIGFQMDDIMASPLSDTALTVVFGEGSVGGSGGCNSYGGNLSVDGDKLTVSAVFATAMSCGDEIDAQEARFLAALQAAESYTIEDGRLVIRYTGGALHFTTGE